MSTYTINKTDGTTLVSVPETTINTSACSVALVGRRAVNYGELTAENFVKLVENFAHTEAPASPLLGQFWYDKSDSTIKIYDGQDWVEVFNTAQQGSFPSGGYSVDDNSIHGNTVVVRNNDGDIFARRFVGIATSALYADIAERFAASEFLQPGDVVDIGGEKEIEKARQANGSALGVISTNPAFRMNEGAGDDETHPFVAFTGRVPCRVIGPARKGDRLAVSQHAGVAHVAEEGSFVFARALEDKEDENIGLMMVVVGVK